MAAKKHFMIKYLFLSFWPVDGKIGVPDQILYFRLWVLKIISPLIIKVLGYSETTYSVDWFLHRFLKNYTSYLYRVLEQDD